MEKINVVTLGCAKNLVDSEVLLARLKNRGFEVVHDSNESCDYVIINTCGFINDAKEESIETILGWTQMKQQKKVKKVFVAGCLSQRYKEELWSEMPEVDAWFGVMDFDRILSELPPSSSCSGSIPRVLTTPPHSAYLKIAEGCDRTCSFCAIPFIRGKNISLPIHEIVDSARWLAQQGVKELNIIAQDTTYYGLDLYRERSLPKLLSYLSAIKGIEWIRILYAYPADFPDELIRVMKENPKICKYIDIPVQHISDKILKSMKRSHSTAQTKDLIARLRKAIPAITIRSSLIVGFPGEGEEEFNELCSFVAETRFDRLGVFKYSPEEGTAAAKLNDDVPDETKQYRYDTLMAMQHQISLENNRKKYKFADCLVLVERKEDDYYIGRSQADAPEVDNEVKIKSAVPLTIGDFYKVSVTDIDAYDLYAIYN